MQKLVVSVLITSFATLSYAEPLTPDETHAQAQGLAESQQYVANPTKRIEVINSNPQAKKIDEQVKELMGNHSEDIYQAAADFLPYILQVGQGDPTKMAEFLVKAKRDPASFMKNLPPELQKRVTDLSQKVKPLPEERKP